MKKILLSVCCIFAASFVFAQTTTKLGIKGGLNLAKLTADAGEAGSGSTGNLTGFHVGIFADFDFEKFSIQPGLFYSTKGGKDEVSGTYGGETYSTRSKTTLNYLEIPVNFVYKVPAGPGKLFIGAGPYIAIGLSGKQTFDESSTDTHFTTNAKFGSGGDEIKNPDFGANFLAGLELKSGLIIGVNYGLGLSDLENTSAGSVKNRVFGVSLGFTFR